MTPFVAGLVSAGPESRFSPGFRHVGAIPITGRLPAGRYSCRNETLSISARSDIPAPHSRRWYVHADQE